jgi:hypothetical protein
LDGFGSQSHVNDLGKVPEEVEDKTLLAWRETAVLFKEPFELVHVGWLDKFSELLALAPHVAQQTLRYQKAFHHVIRLLAPAASCCKLEQFLTRLAHSLEPTLLGQHVDLGHVAINHAHRAGAFLISDASLGGRLRFE